MVIRFETEWHSRFEVLKAPNNEPMKLSMIFLLSLKKDELTEAQTFLLSTESKAFSVRLMKRMKSVRVDDETLKRYKKVSKKIASKKGLVFAHLISFQISVGRQNIH